MLGTTLKRSFWERPAMNLPSGSLLSSSGVSRPDMIVRAGGTKAKPALLSDAPDDDGVAQVNSIHWL